MPKIFDQKKHKILAHLSIPDAEYTDLSPKGSVDEGVRELCDEINTKEGMVTTSSCAGRVAVFLEGGAEGQGKGGGRWLFVSHDVVDMPDEGAIWKLFGIDQHEKIAAPPEEDAASVRFVHFKFEPMILHILTASLQEAQHAHSAAMSAGFRESGISGVSGSEPTPLVAVRTQGLAFDCIIGYQDSSGSVVPMVSEAYLRTVLHMANGRFATNTERKERFRRALLEDSSTGKEGQQGDWEPADVRRERKRAEGLRKQEMKRQETKSRTESEGDLEPGGQGDYGIDQPDER